MRSTKSFSKVADIYSRVPTERDLEQAIVALKKGAKLGLYGGSKIKFAHFHLNPDEEELVYSLEKKEQNLKLCLVSKIIFGQKTSVFLKHPVPEKEEQSLSLLYNNEESSLDLICKDAEEAEIWYFGLRALITRNRRKLELKSERRASLDPTSSCPSPVYSITQSNKGDRDGHMYRTGMHFLHPIKYTESIQFVDRGRSNPSKISEQDLSGFPSQDESESATSDYGTESVAESVSNDKPQPGANIIPASMNIHLWSNAGHSNTWHRNSNPSISPTASAALLNPSISPSASAALLNPSISPSASAALLNPSISPSASAALLNPSISPSASAALLNPSLSPSASAGLLNPSLSPSASVALFNSSISPSASAVLLNPSEPPEAVQGLGSSVHSMTNITDSLHPAPGSYPLLTPELWRNDNSEANLEAWNNHAAPNSDSWSQSDSHSFQTNPRFEVSDVNLRGSLSSALSTSSLGSGIEENEYMGDVYLWGEGTGEGIIGGGQTIPMSESSGSDIKSDSLVPCLLDSGIVLDAKFIACGAGHVILINRRGEMFSWGEEKKGRLGSGTNRDFSNPQIVEALSTHNISIASCGESHTCAVTKTGDLYSWGDNSKAKQLLGHGEDVFNSWIPKKVKFAESVRVASISCGIFHTALISSFGQLFTFGEGIHGALGFGDRKSISIPREVVRLQGLKTLKVSCGVFHTAAIIDVLNSSDYSVSRQMAGKLFTWGDGEKGQLGLERKKNVLEPTMVSTLVDEYMVQVACGQSMTVSLSSKGKVFTMGSNVHGQLGNPESEGTIPYRVEGVLSHKMVDQIACGLHHVIALSSDGAYAWGKGLNGRLGLGDLKDRNTPTLIEALSQKSVLMISCGHTFSAAICQHKPFLNSELNACSQCKQEFTYMKRKHNCYNCGHAFCHSCSSRKTYDAAMAPSSTQPYRVCDSCYSKITKATNSDSSLLKQSSSSLRKKKRYSYNWTKSTRNQGPLNSKSSSSTPALNQNETHRKSKGNLSLDWTCIRPSPLFQPTLELFSSETKSFSPSPSPSSSSPIPILSPIPSAKSITKNSLAKRSNSPLRKLSPIRRSISPLKASSSNNNNTNSNNNNSSSNNSNNININSIGSAVVNNAGNSVGSSSKYPSSSVIGGMSPQELEILTLRKSNETMGHEVNRLRIQVDGLKQKCEEMEQESLVSRAWAERQVESVSKMASEEMAKAKETILELNYTLQGISKKYNIDLDQIVPHTSASALNIMDSLNPVTVIPHPAKTTSKTHTSTSKPSTPRQSSPIRSSSPSKLLERFTFPAFLVSKEKKQSSNPTALSANRSVSDGHYASHDHVSKSAGYAETLKFKAEGSKRTIIAQKSMQHPSMSAEFSSSTRSFSVIEEGTVSAVEDPYPELHDSPKGEEEDREKEGMYSEKEKDKESVDHFYENLKSPERMPRLVAKYLPSSHTPSPFNEENTMRVQAKPTEKMMFKDLEGEKDGREKDFRFAKIITSKTKGMASERRNSLAGEKEGSGGIEEQNQSMEEELDFNQTLKVEEKKTLTERRKSPSVSIRTERQVVEKKSKGLREDSKDEDVNHERKNGEKSSFQVDKHVDAIPSAGEREEKSKHRMHEIEREYSNADVVNVVEKRSEDSEAKGVAEGKGNGEGAGEGKDLEKEKERKESIEKNDAPRDMVVYPEDGVYITIRPNKNGGNELRRVRFSRKLFKEKQAEEWWSENKIFVYRKYDIMTFDRKSHNSSSTTRTKADRSEMESMMPSSAATSYIVNPPSPTSGTTADSPVSQQSENATSASESATSANKTPHVSRALKNASSATPKISTDTTPLSSRSGGSVKVAAMSTPASKSIGHVIAANKALLQGTPSPSIHKTPRWM